MPDQDTRERRRFGEDLLEIGRRLPTRSPFGIKTRSVRTQEHASPAIRLLRAKRATGAAFGRLLAEEAAHGRATLFAPVYMGCGAVYWFARTSDPPLAGISLGLVILTAAFFMGRLSGPVRRHVVFAGMLVLAGMLLAEWQTWRLATVMLDSPVTTTITGRVVRREVDDRGRWRYVIDVATTEAPALRRSPEAVSLLVRGQEAPFDLGDTVRGRARLSPPAGPALPGLHDFAFSAYFDGLGANGFFYGVPWQVSPASAFVEASLAERFDLWLAAARSRIGDRIRMILPGDTGAFAASLVNDERRAISPETIDALRVSGLAHIIAISGLNMALSAGIFYVGLRHGFSLFPGAAQAWPTKKIAAVGALVTLTAYYFISGFGVSAERAFIMMAIMLVAVLLDRPSISLRNVALSAIAILILSPSESLGPSFQMSFAATLALVSGYSLWTRRRTREPFVVPIAGWKPLMTILRFFGGIAMTSVIGGASTAIFSIEHFHRLATYGLVANLAAMPVVSFIVMPVGMLAMLLMPFGLDEIPWKITGFGLDLVIVIAKTVAAWGGNVAFARLPPWLFPVVVAGFLLAMLLRTRLRHVGAATIAASLAFISLAPPRAAPDLLIAEDGELVALVRDGRLEPNRQRPPDFTFDQWQRALAISDWQPPKMLPPDGTPSAGRSKSGARLRLDPGQKSAVREAMENALDTVPDGGFACHGRNWCIAILPDAEILVTIGDAAYLGPACDTADIVVTAARLRLDRCRSGAQLFTGSSLRRTGSVDIGLQSGKPTITAAFDGLQRAWSRHRAYDWHSDTFLSDDASPTPVSDSGG